MNQPQPNNNDLPDFDPDADVQFRQPPQVLAIVTLILGLLSFVALFKITMWVFPIVTIVLGTVSIVSLARNPEKIGRKAALLGLALAIFFGSWAASRHFSRQQWLIGHARRNADIWFKLLQEENLYDAHQLHLDQVDRDGFTGDQPMRSEPWESDYDSFYGSHPLSDFVKVAPRATVEFKRLESYTLFELSDLLVLCYIARYEEDGKPQELELRVVMLRNLKSTTGESVWTVYRVLEPGERL